MTGTKKLAAAGSIALLSGIAMMILLHQFGPGHFAAGSTSTPWSHAMMILLHQFGPGHFAAGSTSTPWAHPMMRGPGEMGWDMTLGPVAMALWFGGILSVIVAFVRSVAKAR